MNDILIAILGGGVAAGIVAGAFELVKFRLQRKASKEDKAEEKADKTDELTEEVHDIDDRIDNLEKNSQAQSEALRLLLLDRVLKLGESYIDAGEISYDDRRRFHAMHDCYHNGLGGNGDADLIVEAVNDLPLKK